MHAASRYQKDNVRLVEGMTRDACCRKYHGKVVLLARRIFERLSSEAPVELGDLVSNGAIGLLDAFERFDGARGIQFSTFAEYRIRGQIYDALRQNDTFTRRRRQEARRLAGALEAVRRQTGRDPNPQEVADYLGMSLDDYWTRLDRTKPVSHVSIDGDDDDDDRRPLVEKLTDNRRPEAETRILVAEVRAQLKAAIQTLPERQRACVLMYYGEEMSLAEIAAVYDVTVSRISQILSEARGRLRKKLKDVLDPADLCMGGAA